MGVGRGRGRITGRAWAGAEAKAGAWAEVEARAEAGAVGGGRGQGEGAQAETEAVGGAGPHGHVCVVAQMLEGARPGDVLVLLEGRYQWPDNTPLHCSLQGQGDRDKVVIQVCARASVSGRTGGGVRCPAVYCAVDVWAVDAGVRWI